MQAYSRIEVWSEIGTSQVFLGEVDQLDSISLLSIWRKVARSFSVKTEQPTTRWKLVLFDDDGVLMGSKYVSESGADQVLSDSGVKIKQSRNLFRSSEILPSSSKFRA